MTVNSGLAVQAKSGAAPAPRCRGYLDARSSDHLCDIQQRYRGERHAH